ncbi:hypothetical protein [Streptomyces sp. NPDC085540]|uniref:hypothetical protein n=1 Tax=Streptomyces sp. NPDC085540 TaxID=3365730 RepID=UPI0037CD77C0
MTFRRVGRPRQLRAAFGAFIGLAAVAFGWYATQSVRPDCTYAISRITDGNGHDMPDANGRAWPDEELVERGYWQAVESGRCDPPRARWQMWTG